MSDKKQGFVPKSFRDAGEEKEYEKGKTYEFTDGEYRNFKAAGLIEDPKTAAKASDKPTA